MSDSSWSTIPVLVTRQTERVLETYRIDPGLIAEHANQERRIHQGGYGDRQIYELVQNGADELLGDHGGEIAVVLTEKHLYCANQGTPMTPEGADTILRMGTSRKRGGQIGRFGVGVKSVLSVTDSPQFFSSGHDGSFGFDRTWAHGLISAIRPDAEEYPVLRIAQLLNRDDHAARDPVLAELLDWATTVVRLPLLAPSAVERLGRDVKRFPKEFCLFSRHVGTITLEDRRNGQVAERKIFQKVDGDHHLIQEDKGGRSSTSEWRVFTRPHRPTSVALKDAGELHDRPEIDISWAVPVDSRRGRQNGRFWAYFPTNFSTTLQGIINAPWKTGEDRQNLYDSNAFNQELIRVAAELVVDSFPHLAQKDDPCAYLDHVPARGREEPQFAATDLVRTIWEMTRERPTLPDQHGEFHPPARMRLAPDDLRVQWTSLWSDYSGRPSEWCHPSVDKTPHRRQSATLILERAGRSKASAREWLEALVQDRTSEASARAVLILADIVSAQGASAGDARKAAVILTENGELVPPSPRVFRRVENGTLAEEGIDYVDGRLFEEHLGYPASLVEKALESLGVHEADAAGRFFAVVQAGFARYTDTHWQEFWELARSAGPGPVKRALHAVDVATSVKVRTFAGEFRPLGRCLLPGAVVPSDGSRDARIAVDVRFHEADRPVLRELGALDGPTPQVEVDQNSSWFEEYRHRVHELYCSTLEGTASRPRLDTIHLAGTAPAGPLHFLTDLSDEGKAAFLQNLPRVGLVTTWTMRLGKQGRSQQVTSPLVWMARTHGVLHTSQGPRPVPKCVGPHLRGHADVLPVAEVPIGVAEVLKLPNELGEIPQRVWNRLVHDASRSTDDAFPGRVYALLIEAGAEWPKSGTIRCRVGPAFSTAHDDAEIVVTAQRSIYESLVRESVPALLVPDEGTAEWMRENWFLRVPADAITRELRYVPDGDSVSAVEEYPRLGIIAPDRVKGRTITRCTELEEIIRTATGMRAEPRESALEDHAVLVLAPEDDLAVLRAIDRELGLGLGERGCSEVLRHRDTERRRHATDARRRRAREAMEIEDKLLALVGETSLKEGLPEGLLDSAFPDGEVSPEARSIARLAIDAHGDAVLHHHRKAIEVNLGESAGFNGDNKSLEFVNEFELPESYAGLREERPPPMEKVAGPVDLPRLHAYQERIAANMVDLLTRYRAGRGMLCLPTGAGKTRVAVEAVIRVIKEHRLDRRPILWIAQTEELCEQAVQSWSFVWSKVGPPGTLQVSRFWGQNSTAQVHDAHHLVVATTAKLSQHLGTEAYAWLRDPALVIIDEAHLSIAPSYTELLESLGLTHRSDSRPLIGLTATPFRGFNQDESERLVQRYRGKRLDKDVFQHDPYAELQELGVLAKVEHRELAGTTLELSDRELSSTAAWGGGLLPRSAEQRLGADDERNAMLLREIHDLPDDGPVLLFAASVNHAKILAARLNGERITAASIDSGTPATQRAQTVKKFRNGEIRVLTNYGVLAQGFDAPATRTVIVARPTYSPNVYQQMIGRGLRGPRNGGKEVCRILDVRDNIVNYNAKLAFTEFEGLWSRS